MKDGKKHGVFWFFKTLLTIALVIYTCVRCCMIVSDKHHVSALDDSGTVVLTPAQTLALYGTQLNALLYEFNNDTPSTIQFEFAFPLNDVGYMDDGGGFDSTYMNSPISIPGSGLTESVIKNIVGSANGLVYVADASQWGGSRIEPYTDFQTRHVQMHVPFSISLNNIGRIQQCLFYSTKNKGSGVSPWSESSNNKLTVLTDIANMQYSSIAGTSYAGYLNPYIFLMPTYQYYVDGNQLDENSLGYFSGFWYDLYEANDYSTPFSVSGMTIDAYLISSVSPNNSNVWLIVGCPRLFGYVPPVVTTTTPAETIPAATYPVQTMPPSYTDTPQNILNQNLITNNYQLNLIIGQLNLIYNQLKLNGELNARLAAALDADNDPGLQFPEHTDIQQYMSEVFYQTGTEFVYSPEDLQSYTRAIPWLSSMLHGQSWFIPFAFLGSIGLLMIVFSYIVFRR